MMANGYHTAYSQPLIPIGGISKRIFDLLVGLILLSFAIPVFVAVGLVLKLTDCGPVFYKQVRIGFGGLPFNCLKFRTMIPNAEQALSALLTADPLARDEWRRRQKLTNDPRITPVGRFFRQTSLDELPQLINVIRGEMSLVGPRPVTRSELARYGNQLEFYLKARPGLTGLWQISGRSDCDFNMRTKLDADYVAGWCFKTDLRILFKTPGAVFSRKGSY